ncbi:MAG: DUF47 family protein [Oscillospiraceae bacterium]|jgi:uncharacterized protein Yka (UPF0111/DUF47 family)|nr:DUF47 family protein [Oscillospiraceae bacterium]
MSDKNAKIKKVKDSDYFEMFYSMALQSNKAAIMLKSISQELVNLKQNMLNLHQIEHEADIMQHELSEILHKAFITPIESEDIMALAKAIDDITDCIEDIGCCFYMCEIKTMQPAEAQFIDIIVESTEILKDALTEFKTFKKSKKLREHIVALKNSESKGDIVYRKAVHDLFLSTTDPIEIIKWRDIYELSEQCCDLFEETANILSAVVLKNS